MFFVTNALSGKIRPVSLMPIKFKGVYGFYDGSVHGHGVRHAEANAGCVMDQIGPSYEGETGLCDGSEFP